MSSIAFYRTQMRSLVALSFIGLAAAGPSAPVYSCPNGFTLTGKACTRQTQTAATLFCATGLLQGNQCLTPAQRGSECPAGSTPTGAGCSIQETVPAERFCPPNTHDIGGECQTYSVTGIVEICARGTLVGGQCEITESIAALTQKNCPLGYEEAKGGCWKHAQMDCTPPHAGKRMLAGKGDAPRYVPQPAKLSVTSKQCEVKLEAPQFAVTTCPGGMEHVGNQCVTKTYEPTTIECSLGAPHLCFPAQTTPGNFRCPAGFQLQGELCTKNVSVPKNSFCPAGTVAHGQACMAPAPAQLRCAAGGTLSGEVCLTQETVEPTVQVTVTCQGKNCYRH